MDFSQIRYFLALADTLNFTRAAEICHVTQPTLTQAIKRLEEELGGALVIRDGKNTRLSDLGKTLRGQFERIQEAKAVLKQTAKSVTSGERIELDIGLMCTIGPRILSRFFEAFERAHPDAMVFLHDVEPGAIPELLLSGSLDGCFCARDEGAHEKLDPIPLYLERMVTAFPDGHPFSDADAVPLETVGRQRYLDRLHCEFRETFHHFCAEKSIMVDAVFTSQREDWIQMMIRKGLGVAVLPEFSLIPPALPHRPVTEPTLQRHVEFTTVYGGLKSPGLRSMIAMLKSYRWSEAIEAERAVGR